MSLIRRRSQGGGQQHRPEQRACGPAGDGRDLAETVRISIDTGDPLHGS
jgi:hypothetical protein